MNTLIPLSDWLRCAPDRPVATGADGLVSRADLVARVRYWYQQLPASPGQRWAVFHKDTVEFLALLLALWQHQCTVCLPGDDRPATTARLQQRVNGFAGQYPDAITNAAEHSGESVPIPAWKALPSDFPALELFTSGSTGMPKAVAKSFAQLQSELAALETLWPGQNDAVIVTTVSHQHLYGLTFRLLWPLSKGQIFERTLCEFTEDIYQQARQYPQFVLVSTPSHLSRFNPTLDWQQLSPCCRGVLSSAAPLQRQDSLTIAGLLDTPVREIYGSSETGAVAWRSQRIDEEARWSLLPGIEMRLNSDSTLNLTGPQIAGQQDLPDIVVMAPDGSFELQGRADRIAKIEGKRIALTAVEHIAEQQPLLRSARALVIQRNRVEVAMVAELSSDGRDYLRQHGKLKLVRQLRAALLAHFEPVALPRRWRFVEQMPYNQQGKITVDALTALFDQDELKWPDILRQERQAQSVEMTLHIPARLVYFDGHFEGNPVLPGITQVHWAIHYGRQLLGCEGTFTRMEVIKFQQVIFPEADVQLALDYASDKQKLSFRYYSEKGVHSSGRICFN
ncbi:AMP-binding protein [Pokkaliibacter sp. CJK22405]|uniref:AMP-binding protein n=1 Tax=Pokkaliibacter sp. CJK22405 TaxID=3384615 RepID=UPI00398523F2